MVFETIDRGPNPRRRTEFGYVTQLAEWRPFKPHVERSSRSIFTSNSGQEARHYSDKVETVRSNRTCCTADWTGHANTKNKHDGILLLGSLLSHPAQFK